MKVIIDLPNSIVLDANPLLLNALTQAQVVSRNYENGIRYVVEETQQVRMSFMDDAEFEQALLDKKETLSNG